MRRSVQASFLVSLLGLAAGGCSGDIGDTPAAAPDAQGDTEADVTVADALPDALPDALADTTLVDGASVDGSVDDTPAAEVAGDASSDDATIGDVATDATELDTLAPDALVSDATDAGTDTAPADTGPLASPTGQPGALVRVNMTSRVGVLLDEIPAAMRARVAASLVAKPAAFWIARATEQTKLTTYRLVFRQYYYGSTKWQLPLPPPNQWKFTLSSAPVRATVDGHDLVLVDYAFESVLLTDPASPGTSEPKLDKVGGVWDEPFVFPLDPELLFQRTRFACMDEAEFPLGSVDSEEVDTFYDQDCKVEKSLTNTGCHQSELPQQSCVQALDAKVGKIATHLRFTRVAWDAGVADAVRVGPITSKTGADLQVVEEDFRQNRVSYKYIAPDSCTLAEHCVGGPGWRRLVQFGTADKNTGSKTLLIGQVDYFLDGAGGPLADHGVFELDACHAHYHFSHYGSFTYGTPPGGTAGDAGGDGITNKRGFCLQSTNRYSNHELSPLHNPYAGCDYQGIEVGWVDQYKAGLDCQWVDVTSYDTKTAPVTRPLTFTSNPDGFLCEGNYVRDANGDIVWEPTPFTTHDGKPVDRMRCDFTPAYFANNVDTYDVTLPLDGEGYVTAPCTRGQVGPLRNCGFRPSVRKVACAAGATVTLRCTSAATSAPQVVRVCETSAVLGTSIPCTQQDSVTTSTVDPAGVDVSFTCPGARSPSEPGGAYSLYTAPVFDDDGAAPVTCVPK